MGSAGDTGIRALNRVTPPGITPRQLAALLLGPLLVAAAVYAATVLLLPREPESSGNDPNYSREVDDAFLEASVAVTEAALLTSVPAATATAAGPPLNGRLVGLGIYFNDGEFYEWEGTPLTVPHALRSPAASSWTTIRTGFKDRLVVVTGRDNTGRRASATFDLPALDPPAPATRPRPAPGRLAAAAAALVFTLLLAFLFSRGSATGGLRRSGAALAALAAGRWALAAAHVPSILLPPEIGSATIYGSGYAWGLLASPADLLLTCAACWLGIRIVLGAVRPGGRLAALAVAVLLTAASMFWLRTVSVSLARNSDIRLLDSRFLLVDIPGTILVAALALAVLVAAECFLRLLGTLLAGSESVAWRRVLATLVMALIATSLLLKGKEQVDLERLRTEYTPQVLEQASRRVVALRSALRRAAASPEVRTALSDPSDLPDSGGASRIWIEGDLLEAGYRSSLTIHDAGGVAISHFGFGLPLLEEDPSELASDCPDGEVLTELFEPIGSLGSVRHNLLHSQLAVAGDRGSSGWVVAHVLDEPDNLPFLPANRAYLEALAPERVPSQGGSASPDPDYVLYDSAGIVQFTTLVQPPAWKVEYDKAAFDGLTLRISTAAGEYHALPLLERDRLHLLLSPARSLLEWAGAVVRLALAAILILGLLHGLPLLFSRSGPTRVLGMVRRSFHRKLMTTLLLVSVIPLMVLALFLMRAIENRMDTALLDTASRYGAMARRVVEDYGTNQLSGEEDQQPVFDDNLLFWLKRVVGQDIHLFEDGILTASSQRELFQAGLMIPRLPGSIYRELLQENKPARVLSSRLGQSRIPVAYAPVRLDDPSRKIVVAVPLLYPQTEIRRAINRVVELLILTTVALVGLLAIAATVTARTVARPVRDLVTATIRIADGRYNTRLVPRTQDELADLVNGFNGMATSLEAQRANLTRRKDYIEALLTHATAGVISTDPDGRIVTINPAARTLLGFSEHKPADGDLLSEFVSSIPRLGPLSVALARPAHATEPQEIDLEAAGGHPDKRRLSLVRVPLPGLEGRSQGGLLIMDDVTDMMRSSQLEAWAEMARAIAHEIKNPLTPIQLSTEHLERILEDRNILPSEDLASCLDTIKKQVRALREIAAGFSTYAKLPVLQPETVDPVSFLRDTVAPYRAVPPDGLKIVEEYRPCPVISIDAKVLARAIVNLIENGLQAMGDGSGTLTARVVPEPDDGGVRITIGDTGTGLDPDVRNRLFEPYFSTKSSGTGLGLAIVKRSVEAHGGRMEVDSRPGEGSRFHILLPLPGAGV